MYEKKLVAVLNEKIEPGKVMNGLAHMCIGFGSEIGKEPLRLCEYIDADGGNHPHISEMPFIILKAKNSNKIRALRQASLDSDIACVDFTDTMTVGTYEQQLERMKETGEADLEYFGIVLFGEWDAVSSLTKKFSLWR